ncbi:hypothetical protein CG709_16445, partial [Lachnotalea glycerini]
SVTSKDIPEIFNMFGDVFTLLKKYYMPESNDEFWEQLKAEVDVIYSKYKTQLCKDILLAIANDIDRRYKERIKQDG